MSNPLQETLKTDRIMMDLGNMHKVDRFIAYDKDCRTSGRRIRKSAKPDFEVTIRFDIDGEINDETHMAMIVATNVPHDDSSKVESGAPIAVAQIDIDDTAFYTLVSRSTGMDTNLHISDTLVAYDGEPEELLDQPELFEHED